MALLANSTLVFCPPQHFLLSGSQLTGQLTCQSTIQSSLKVFFVVCIALHPSSCYMRCIWIREEQHFLVLYSFLFNINYAVGFQKKTLVFCPRVIHALYFIPVSKLITYSCIYIYLCRHYTHIYICTYISYLLV